MILPFSFFPTVELGLGDAKLQNSTAHSRRFSAALSLGKQAASMAPPWPAGGAVAVVRHDLGVGERGKSYRVHVSASLLNGVLVIARPLARPYTFPLSLSPSLTQTSAVRSRPPTRQSDLKRSLPR